MNDASSQSKVLLAVAAAALVGAGCLPAPGADNAFYVLLPYAAAVVFCALAAAAAFGLTLRDRPRKDGTPRPAPDLALRANIAALSCATCLVGEVAHLLVFGADGFGYQELAAASDPMARLPWALAYLALVLLAGLALRRAAGCAPRSS